VIGVLGIIKDVLKADVAPAKCIKHEQELATLVVVTHKANQDV
jgi:hypothetical protein